MSAPASFMASARRSASSMPSTRTALVRPTITRLGSVRAATASRMRSAASSIGTRLSMPMWCSTRRGRSWSSISMHSTPAASDMVTVRWMWTGSPQPPPASSTTGILQTVRMSTTTWIISDSDRPASVTPLYQPSEPPREIGRLEAGQRRHLRHDRVERDRRDDQVGAFDEVFEFFHAGILRVRHARACPGHPRLYTGGS